MSHCRQPKATRSIGQRDTPLLGVENGFSLRYLSQPLELTSVGHNSNCTGPTPRSQILPRMLFLFRLRGSSPLKMLYEDCPHIDIVFSAAQLTTTAFTNIQNKYLQCRPPKLSKSPILAVSKPDTGCPIPMMPPNPPSYSSTRLPPPPSFTKNNTRTRTSHPK